MMAELRRLRYLLDNNGIHVMARYIRSAANVWSGAAATVVAPRWKGKMSYHALTEMAVAERVVPLRPELFTPGRMVGSGMLGAPRWAVSIFRMPFRPGCTCAVAP
eukprot:jgi/Tetstr1/441509/TSEL_029740.t1